jgi:hypothetical protein
MAKFTLMVELDNAAFGDDDLSREWELRRILRDAEGQLKAMGIREFAAPWPGDLNDYNGNNVGGFVVEGLEPLLPARRAE